MVLKWARGDNLVPTRKISTAQEQSSQMALASTLINSLHRKDKVSDNTATHLPSLPFIQFLQVTAEAHEQGNLGKFAPLLTLLYLCYVQRTLLLRTVKWQLSLKVKKINKNVQLIWWLNLLNILTSPFIKRFTWLCYSLYLGEIVAIMQICSAQSAGAMMFSSTNKINVTGYNYCRVFNW